MYKAVAIGGTFDRLHKGHRFFIAKAFEYGKRVIIGLTSDEYVSKKSKIIPIKSGQKSPKYAYLASEVSPSTTPASTGQSSLVSARGANSGQAKLKITEGDKDTSDGGPKGLSCKELLRGGGINKGRSPEIQSYQERERELKKFLREEDLLERAEIVKIDDIYGPAAESEEIEALLVTSETMEGARLVNQRRRLKHLKPLKILKIPLILADDKKRIASTRIRFGEIDRDGVPPARCANALLGGGTSRKENIPYGRISETLRQALKKPQGILLKRDPQNPQKLVQELKKQIKRLRPTMISTIGDEVTLVCNQSDIPINLAIIDYKVARKEKYYSLSELGFAKRHLPGGEATTSTPGMVEGVKESVTQVRNSAGNISKTLVKSVKKSIRGFIQDGKARLIKVIGEEDLAGVPAILLSPLGSVVLYGQPGEGVVLVEITEKKKQELFELLERCS